MSIHLLPTRKLAWQAFFPLSTFFTTTRYHMLATSLRSVAYKLT